MGTIAICKNNVITIKTHIPYDNVRAQDYPAILLDSGISDEQTYWEPTKMVAKLTELSTGSNPIVLNMRMSSGHHGASKRYKSIRETAFHYSFVLRAFLVDGTL